MVTQSLGKRSVSETFSFLTHLVRGIVTLNIHENNSAITLTQPIKLLVPVTVPNPLKTKSFNSFCQDQRPSVVSTGVSTAVFNVISGPLQGMQDSNQYQSMLQTKQDKAIKGVQEVKNFIPKLEDLHFLSQGLSNDTLVKRLQELQEKFVSDEKKKRRSEIEREKKSEEELCFVAKRETGESGEEDGR